LIFSSSPSSKGRPLIFYGRFPALNEVGGVTTFTFNFAKSLHENDIKYVDLYHAEGKIIPLDTKVVFLSKVKVFRTFQFLSYVFTSNTIHFFNFSSVRALVLFAFLPKVIKSRWIGIFHHGDQAKEFGKLNIIQRLFFRLSLRRFDRVGCISSRQFDFFSKFSQSELCQVTPYIPESNLATNSLNNKTFASSILISGFPSSIYRIIETLEVLASLHEEGNVFSVSVCIYGVNNLSEKECLLSEIEKTIDSLSWVQLHSHLASGEFMAVMRGCNLYLRMNSADSFGLAVAEAIDNGLNVIATNVCERYPGAYLIDVDDFVCLEKALSYYLNGGDLRDILEVQEQKNIITEILDFVSF
jgi:glycosyltransferase involved in cell wall biosynthesis